MPTPPRASRARSRNSGAWPRRPARPRRRRGQGCCEGTLSCFCRARRAANGPVANLRRTCGRHGRVRARRGPDAATPGPQPNDPPAPREIAPRATGRTWPFGLGGRRGDRRTRSPCRDRCRSPRSRRSSQRSRRYATSPLDEHVSRTYGRLRRELEELVLAAEDRAHRFVGEHSLMERRWGARLCRVANSPSTGRYPRKANQARVEGAPRAGKREPRGTGAARTAPAKRCEGQIRRAGSRRRRSRSPSRRRTRS
jgi:hypothetical protein